MHFTHFLIIYKLLLVHSAALEVNLKKTTSSGRMVTVIQFFALISNLKSEFEKFDVLSPPTTSTHKGKRNSFSPYTKILASLDQPS